MKGVHISCHDGLQRLYNGAGGGNGIHSVIRVSAVAAHALYGDHEPVHRSRHRALPQADDAGLIRRVRMESPEELHIITYIRFQDFQRAQGGFLSRLKQKLHRSGELPPPFLQQKRRADSCRNVKIMPACVHPSRRFRGIRKACFFHYGKSVDITAQSLHRPLLFPTDHGSQSRFQRKRQNFDPRIRQKLPDPLRGAVFLI